MTGSPLVTRRNTPRRNWETYERLLNFAGAVYRDDRDLRPLDMINLQSFIWVQGRMSTGSDGRHR